MSIFCFVFRREEEKLKEEIFLQADNMMSCPLPIVPVIQQLPNLNSQADFPINIGIKVRHSHHVQHNNEINSCMKLLTCLEVTHLVII